MERKTVLGLKATPLPIFQDDNDEEDEIDFFESESSDKGLLSLSIKPSTSAHHDLTLHPLTPMKSINKITSFDEASPQISAFLPSLADYKIPPAFQGALFFIPEHIVSEQFSEELDAFARSADPQRDFVIGDNNDGNNLHINVLAQIAIVRHYKKMPDVNLADFIGFEQPNSNMTNIDSRVSALIHFCLAENTDHQVSAYHRIQAISEFLKSPTLAPISSLFDGFDLQKIVHGLCSDLVSMFPHHPLLPSLIDKFSSVDPACVDMLSLIPEDDSDDDSDFSSSFFQSLEDVQNRPPPIDFQTLNIFNECITNALENCQASLSNIITITVREPPSMVTFKQCISDANSSQLTPNLFQDWIISLPGKSRPPFAPVLSTQPVNIPNQRHRNSDNDYRSLPTSLHTNSDEIDATPEMLIDLLNYSGSPKDLQRDLPTTVDPGLFPLHYPLLHLVNASSAVLQKRGCIYPSVMSSEFDAHTILNRDSFEGLQKCVDKIAKLIKVDEIQGIPIERINKKRDPPTKDTTSPEMMISLIALSDIEFILNGRSPLTLSHNSRQPSVQIELSKTWREEALFSLYSSSVYPPYLSFRAAFALALNKSETNLSLAADLMFEGIYILLNAFPQMVRLEFVRNSILYLAEILEKLDRYYYSSIFLDVFYLTNIADTRSSNAIALLCQRNLDIVRAVYFFTQSMVGLVESIKCDEALYVAQILSSIYTDYSNTEDAISILSFLLRNTYNFTLGVKQLPEADTSLKSMNTIQPRRPPRPKKPSPISQFKPGADLLNTILAGTSLCELLIKTRHFSLASQLLTTLRESTDNIIFNKLLDYLAIRFLLKQNLFNHFLKNINEIQFKIRHGTPSARLSILSAANFDTSLATVRLLISGYTNRRLFKLALLWSEIFINAQPKLAMKDIGNGFLSRGYALYHAVHYLHSTKPPYNLRSVLSGIASKVAEYVNEKEYQNSTEVLVEALSSLKGAQICLDKVGSQRQLTQASILYADLLLLHFFDSQFEGETEVESLTISEPVLEVQNIGMPQNKVVTFSPYVVDKTNVVDELRKIFHRIDSISARCMNPVNILSYQVLFAKFHFMQGKIEVSKTVFDYAFSNMKRYFVCGGNFFARDLNFPTITSFLSMVTNMCLLLLFYDQNFINDRLIVFDWMKNVNSLYQHRLRVTNEENKDPLESTMNVSISSLRSMSSLKFTDFFQTLQNAGIDVTKQTKEPKKLISQCLARINANIRLFETGKMSEEEMHANNKNLCKQIEQIADDYRRNHESRVPIDITYSYVSRTVPMVHSIIFLQHINNAIYIYNPSTGVKKRVLLQPTDKYHITTNSNKGDVKVGSTSGLFSSKFFETVSLYMMCDKKQHHDDYNSRMARNLCIEAKNALFGDMCDDLIKWTKTPDNHFFGENRIFGKGLKGALCSIETAGQPTIFITSADLCALPLEMMFPDVLILRCWSYTHVILKPNEELDFPKPTVCRWRGNPEHLMKVAVKRSREDMLEFVEAIGGDIPHTPYVSNNERNVCFPFPLFSSNLANPYYASKFPFCEFVNVEPDVFPSIKSALFIFTYSDLCEMPLMLESLVSEFPFCFYMFIPAQFVREAFQQMVLIFDRHQRRIHFIEEHKEDPTLTQHAIISQVPFDFVTILQTTLMQQLDCPIPLIAPTH